MNKQALDTKTMMSNAKFYESYARYNYDESRYETWNEAVSRVMGMHRTYYANIQSTELDTILTYAQEAYSDKQILGAQRALQFGGEQLLRNHAKLYNCFSGDTKFVTTGGVTSFHEAGEGATVVVPTHTGQYKPAKVKTYGEQQLYNITFGKGDARNSIKATKDHRWLLTNGEETTSLKVGDKVLQASGTFQDFSWESATSQEKKYWLYGLIFGDGTVSGEHSHIRLCKRDARFASRFEELGFKTSKPESLNGDIYAYTGTYKKTAPDPTVDSMELIRAFVAGYLQADGEKNRNFKHSGGKMYNSIQASDLLHIKFIRECFPIAGVYILNETDLTGQVTNYGTRPFTIRFSLHEGAYKHSKTWKVLAIDKLNVETVWCLEVEDDKSFTLVNGIVTGNCTATYLDRPDFFKEAFYLMLSGCGIGFSVQTHHIAKLPTIAKRTEDAITFVVEDSIEGWADAAGALVDSFFTSDSEYRGHKIYFDLSLIRPKGAEISGGFKAPGPEPLRKALDKMELLIKEELSAGRDRLRTIVAYDLTMFMADAVISGGVRRSASICLFSKTDTDMITAKTGDWFVSSPQRGRSNNSAVLLRNDTTEAEFKEIMKSVEHSGEPGFVWTDDLEILFNPCVEVGMYGYDDEGNSGWQKCNLTEINGAKSNTPEEFYEQCKAAAILGTLQAGYTDFNYLTATTKRIVTREALIGVGVTGWMNNPDVLFDVEVQHKGAEVVKYWNKYTADLIGINQAARCTVVKPSGNASVLLGTASGIHGEHSPRYIRHVQMNKESEVAQLILKKNPAMCEESVWSANGSDIVIGFPIVSPEGSIYKSELLGIKQLEYVKNAQQNWIEQGTNYDKCVKPYLRHNVSNTITVDDWTKVGDYIYANREHFCGISLLPASGDKAYPQAPFTEVLTHEQITTKYGVEAMFSSGLIEAGLNAFNDNLWTATSTALGYGEVLTDKHEHLLKRDFIRRFNKFATNFNSSEECVSCLLDVYNLHKWWKIQNSIHDIEWATALGAKEFVSVDTLGSSGCSGGNCDVEF